MTTLVTGATGFVGSAVARRLISLGHDVRVLARPGGDRRNLADLKVDIAEGNLMDRASLDRAAKGCEALFHVAADYRLWCPNPQEIIDCNVQGTRNVILAAAEAGAKRMVYTSSVAVLGKVKNGESSDEEAPVTVKDMIGAYKTSKFLAEEEVNKLIAQHKLDCVIVNPSTPMGPRDIKPTPTGRMVVQTARGKMPVIVDTGLNIAHVDDVAEGHILAYQRGKAGRRYILAGDNLTLRQITEIISKFTGRRPPRISMPHDTLMPFAYIAEWWATYVSKTEPMTTVDGLNQSRRKMYFTSDRAEKEIGYTHRPASEALGDAVAWFKTHGYLT